MSLKTVVFTVGTDGVLSPSTVQSAGVQGDHRVTELKFEFSDELHTWLQEKGGEGKLVYRFDGYDGHGSVHHSDTAILCERSVTYPLEYSLTQYGGLIKVELIITLVSDDTSAEVLHTCAAPLKLVFSPYSTGDNKQTYADLSTLAEVAKENAEKAIQASQEAIAAQKGTEELSAVLQVGGEYIFDGGNASSVIPEIIVDTDVSDYSNNAVMNKAIKSYVDNIVEEHSDALQDQIDTMSGRDYIVEQGTDDNGWEYRKWKSGVAECSIIKSVSKTLSQKSGAFWYSFVENSELSFPSGLFVGSAPKTFVTVEEKRGNVFLTKTSATTENAGTIYLYTWVTENYELSECKVHVHAIGKCEV